MHSSNLRGTDFEICVNNQPITHADFFAGFSNLTRVGIIAPNGVDGVGATALLMAFVTAFYDTYRAQGGEFFAYPAYYSFQHVRPLASYTMLDIWPTHKDVYVENSPVELLHAINDRAIDILLLPEQEPTDPGYEQPQIEAALRRISKCFLYSAAGSVADATLDITVHARPVVEWTEFIFNDHKNQPILDFAEQKTAWQALHRDARFLKQSFRQISVEEALARLTR